MSRVAAFVVALCACGSKQQGTAAPTCVQVADHVLSLLTRPGRALPATPVPALDERAVDIREVFATRCTQDRWAAAPMHCMLGTKSLEDPRGCKAKLSDEQRGALDANLAVAEEKARDRPPAECVEYEQVILKVSACKKLAISSRESLQRAFDSSKATWKTTTSRADLAASCKAGADGTRQVIASACGS
jgi:hypothetical protein